MSKSQQTICRAASLCEEFCEYVLYDSVHCSIVLNVHIDRFPILRKELKKFKYHIKHMTKLEDLQSVTCVFIQI